MSVMKHLKLAFFAAATVLMLAGTAMAGETAGAITDQAAPVNDTAPRLSDQAKQEVTRVAAAHDSAQSGKLDTTDTVKEKGNPSGDAKFDSGYPQVTIGGSIELRYFTRGTM
jgi:hypothetical protein